MLIEASLTKNIQEETNRRMREYKKLENHIGEKIFSAASTGSGFCDFSITYTKEDENNLRKITDKLRELGYSGGLLVTPKTLTLEITW